MAQRDKRKGWSLRDVRLNYQVMGAQFPVLYATIDGGPEDGRQVIANIDPYVIRDMVQAMIDEKEAL